MRLIKCENGHVYDRDKLGNCPHCPGVIRRLEYEPDTFGKDQKECTTEISEKGDKGGSDVVKRKQVGLLVTKNGKRRGRLISFMREPTGSGGQRTWRYPFRRRIRYPGTGMRKYFIRMAAFSCLC